MIVEFSDYQDPSSSTFLKETKILIKKSSLLSASVAYFAAEQGMYWEYHNE